MTTRFRNSLAAGVAALMLAGAAPAVFAQDQPQQQQQRRRGPGIDPTTQSPRRWGPGMGSPIRGGFGLQFRGLDLTDDQRAQLRKIREARQDEFKAAGEKLRAARAGMRQLLTGDSINEPAIRSKATEVAAAEAEVAILNARLRQESLQILTAEQQQKLKELREQRGARQKQRRGPR